LPKILVIDDEDMIRAGIVSIVRRLAPRWSVSECRDAAGAIRALTADKPDLMLIDVSMPGMDGLELSHYLKEHEPGILKIVLTGHDKFAYVQNALRAEVLDYLLKPVIREELVEALNKAERTLIERDKARIREETAKADGLRQALEDVLIGLPHAEQRLKRRLEEQGWPSAPGAYSLLLLARDHENFPSESGEEARTLIGDFRAAFSEEERVIAFFADRRHFFVFAAGRESPLESMLVWWSKALASLGEEDLEQGAADIRRAGASVASLEELPERYGNLIRGLYPEEGDLLRIASHEGKAQHDQDYRLRVALETNDHEALREVLKEVFLKMKQLTGDQSSIMRHRAVHFVLRSLMPALNRTESRLTQEFRATVADLLSRLAVPGSKVGTMTIVSEFENRISALAARNPEGQERNKTVETIKSYLRQNYGDKSLSLDALSKVVHMNGNYVSNLFKEVTGENYLGFLTSIRMEEAKKMLRDTTLKTYEIADRAGYSSTKYFCKLFRQLHEMTPSDYRNRAQASSDESAEASVER